VQPGQSAVSSQQSPCCLLPTAYCLRRRYVQPSLGSCPGLGRRRRPFVHPVSMTRQVPRTIRRWCLPAARPWSSALVVT